MPIQNFITGAVAIPRGNARNCAQVVCHLTPATPKRPRFPITPPNPSTLTGAALTDKLQPFDDCKTSG